MISASTNSDPHPRPIEGIMFDLDGTLIPTMQGFADIAAEVIFENYKMPSAEARDAYMRTSGLPFFQQLEVLFQDNPSNSKAAEAFESRKAVYFRSVTMPEDVKAALKQLRRNHLKLAVSSNNFESLVQEMIHREIPETFHPVCGFRHDFAKGEAHTRLIEELWKLPRSAILFVGDSLSDLRKAKSLGLPFLGILGTFTLKEFQSLDPEAVAVHSVAELPAILNASSESTRKLERPRPRGPMAWT